MVEINLLVWRTQKNRYEHKIIRQFVLAGMVAAFLLVSVAHVFLSAVIGQQARRVASLGEGLPAIDSKGDLMSVARREQLFLAPSAVIKFLEAAGLSVQYGVCYQRFLRDDTHLTFFGNAWSLTSVTSGLHRLEASAIFDGIKLREIKRQTGNDWLQFILDVGGG